MQQHRVIHVEERLPLLPTIPLSLQHLFAMFGSTVLVPFLLHVDPATALFMNGVGTLLYLTICKWRLPAYLGSSFAFISPVLAVTATPGMTYGDAQGGSSSSACPLSSWRLSSTRWGRSGSISCSRRLPWDQS